MCCCGLNSISNLPASIADKSDGAPVDVSGMQATKTIEVSGSYLGAYTVLGSHDGNLYFPVASFDSGAGAQTVRRTLEVVARFMKVHREAPQSGLVTINIAARSTVACSTSGQSGANSFFSLATLQPGAKGPQAPLDLFTLVSATGVDVSSIACGGAFLGQISIEGSLDGINYSPLASFSSSQSQRGLNPSQSSFDPVVVEEICRFVRANVQPGTVVTGPTALTLGGPQNCDCSVGCNMHVHPLITGTVGLWQFQGDLTDISGNGYDLTPSPLIPVPGYEDMGCLLGVTMVTAPGGDNVRDYYNMYNLLAPALALGGELTIEFLFKPRNGPADVVGYVSDYRDVVGPLRVMYEWDWSPNFVVVPGHNYFDHFFAGGELTPNVTNRGTDNSPNHYALRRKSLGGIDLRVEIFINGILQPGFLDTTTGVAPGLEEFLVGGFSINAAMATLRIVNYARSDAEILADAHLTLGT